MRYEHFLDQQTPGAYPACIVAVDADGTEEESVDSPGTRIERLSEWHAVSMRGDGGSYGRAKAWAGKSWESFWRQLQDYRGSKKLLWIVSYRCLRNASLLNIWSLVESGTLRFGMAGSLPPREYLTPNRLRTESAVILNDPPTVLQLSWPHGGNQLKWVDSRNYGIEFGEKDYTAEIRARMQLDAMRRMIGHLRDRRLGGLKATAASQAYHSFRSQFYHHAILCHTHASALQLERKSYYGGRCEAYRIGDIKGPVWHLDYRSLYPYCSYMNTVPVRLVSHVKYQAPKADEMKSSEVSCICDCTIKTDEADYPVRKGGFTIWPVGRFRTTLCFPEYQDAYIRGRIEHVHSVAWYQMQPALRPYIDAWYDLRCQLDGEHDSMLASWAKRCLNCIVGKFGERDTRWVPYERGIADRPWEVWIGKDQHGAVCRYRSLAWHVQREEDHGYGNDAVPAIAAWITSLARMRLLKAIRIAGRENVYYVDTDSLFVNETGYAQLSAAKMIQQCEMGYLQPRGRHDTCTFLGVKHYATDGELTCSGVPRCQLNEVIASGYIVSCEHVSGSLQHGRMPSARITRRTYKRSLAYPLGNVCQDGSVKPFTLGV